MSDKNIFIKLINRIKQHEIQAIYNSALFWVFVPFFLYILITLPMKGPIPIRYTTLFFLWPTTVIFLLGIAQLVHKEIPSYPPKKSITGWPAIILSLAQILLMAVVIYYLIKSVICNC